MESIKVVFVRMTVVMLEKLDSMSFVIASKGWNGVAAVWFPHVPAVLLI